TYNLYIGTSPGFVNRKSPMASLEPLTNGYRRIVRKGSQTNTWSIKNLPAATYYWSVQAIDNTFAGSAFATEGNFTIAFSNSIAPVADQSLLINQNGSPLTVTESSAVSRQWKYSTVSGGPYDQIITGATGTSYTPNFPAWGTYYVVCVSTKSAIEYITNEVKIFLPVFQETGISLTGVYQSSVAWGDYDSDGDLDILLTGNGSSGYFSKVYRNDLNVFNDINAGLTGVGENSAVAWGDYDKDGDLDILLTGYVANSNYISKIYRNDSGVFTDINAGLTGVYASSVAWGDYDNDGDLDVLLTGYDGSGNILKIYRNDSGVFTDINSGLSGVQRGSVAWGDYDNDGYLDILITGSGTSRIYRNNGNNTFTNQSSISLSGVSNSSSAWGDYDNDGYLDILITGSGTSRIYRNNGDNTFTLQTSITLQGVSYGSAAWGDYDNDGDMDILLTGSGNSKIYRNNGDGSFTEQTGTTLAGMENSSAAWGDYDGDGDLDILLSGYNSNCYALIYKNTSSVLNTAPAAPTNLQSTGVSINKVILTWNKASDTQTPQNTLTYNIRVGTTTGGRNILNPMASTSNGYRRIPAMGNAGLKNNGYAIDKLAPGKYYWSVQAVDQAYAGGAWATESSFLLLAAPVASAATNIAQTSFTANWSSSTGATGYRLDVATDSTFTTILSGYNNKDVGNVTTTSVTGLTASTNYYYRIRSYSAAGTSIVNSNIIKPVTLTYMPGIPTANVVTIMAQTSFSAEWTSSATATGYRLDVATNSSFTTFVSGFNDKDVSNVTNYSVTGLTANTTYYYRIRAYNVSGTSTNSATITTKTLPNSPAAPAGFSASSCNNLVTLTWNANTESDFLRYRIYGGTSANPTTKIDSTATSVISEITKTISGLISGQTYYLRITAVISPGVESAFSTSASVKVKTGVIPKIKAKWNDILISYNTGDSIATFQWYKGTTAITDATKQFYVTNKQAGSYYIQTTDKNGCKNASNIIAITGAKSISVYPNPASTIFELSINCEVFGKTIISLYNSSGIKVLEYQTEKPDFELTREIPIAGIQTGTYTLEVSVNNEKIDYSRIVIVK
ncbi:MAG: FG-GAP-like repeat-containing protein, partial [Bacteroidia bacterium]|nr:FG-GAP-like repeat-containing protein [Bacteroidia bacterium]